MGFFERLGWRIDRWLERRNPAPPISLDEIIAEALKSANGPSFTSNNALMEHLSKRKGRPVELPCDCEG